MFHNVTLLMCIICNILCFAIATAISKFDSETCNTPPKRLWIGRAGKKFQDLRQCTLKVPCRCTKQCIIRIPKLHRIGIWTESWNQGRQTGGGGWLGVATPPDFERTCCLIAHIVPFLIA